MILSTPPNPAFTTTLHPTHPHSPSSCPILTLLFFWWAFTHLCWLPVSHSSLLDTTCVPPSTRFLGVPRPPLKLVRRGHASVSPLRLGRRLSTTVSGPALEYRLSVVGGFGWSRIGLSTTGRLVSGSGRSSLASFTGGLSLERDESLDFDVTRVKELVVVIKLISIKENRGTISSTTQMYKVFKSAWCHTVYTSVNFYWM